PGQLVQEPAHVAHAEHAVSNIVLRRHADRRRRGQMRVHVPQAGDDILAPGVDHACAARHLDVADRGDLAVVDQHGRGCLASRRIDHRAAGDGQRRSVGAGQACKQREGCELHTSSTASAVASPPPMHSDATPRVLPRAFSACRSVTTMRAPEAPMGWPSAQAPPLTLTLAWSRPRSRIAIIATAAKASLISNRSTWSLVQPASLSTFSMAPTGAVVNQRGSAAWLACATMRATGFSPFSLATSARARISAAAPSEIEDEFAAVTVPSLAKAGLSVGIFAASALRGCSSAPTLASPPLAGTFT